MQCPAREAVCRKYSKKGRFKSVCRSKSTIGDVTELEDEIAFLDTVTAKGKAVDCQPLPQQLREGVLGSSRRRRDSIFRERV